MRGPGSFFYLTVRDNNMYAVDYNIIVIIIVSLGDLCDPRENLKVGW